MNAETRAKELLAAIAERGTGGWRFAAEVEESLPLIAAAITRAENDKLEEAARVAGASNTSDPYDYGNGWSDAADEIAQQIRALKKD
jgi:hypothetical protein